MDASTRKAAEARIDFKVRSIEDPLRLDGPNVIRNLTLTPKKISSLYLYDKRGTELFEQQCGTPEYYLRRAETQLLRAHAKEIIKLTGLIPIVELGAGTADKTRILFSEYEDRGARCDYYPIDVDTETLFDAACGLVSGFPHLFVHCVGTTYEHGLRALSAGFGARLFVFLGSSIGNMELNEIDNLLSDLFECSSPGDYLLLGADLDKDPAIIDRAYNDAAGYGPRSTLNMLHHLNHRYDGNFVVADFRYRSRYDPHARRNDVSLESMVAQVVTLADLALTVSLTAGECIDAEVMWKFAPDELGTILHRAGFSMTRRWIDPIYRYGLFLLRR